jgi:beta-glucanase (GH16 family)
VIRPLRCCWAAVLSGAIVCLAACGGGGSDSTTPTLPNVPSALPAASSYVPSGYQLVWFDEFSANGLPDASRWGYDTSRNSVGWFNNELQYYADQRSENSRVGDGTLSIEARKETLSTAKDYGGQRYTSARLLTRGKAAWTYGYFEVRAKLPCSAGTWPAIWMLGSGGTWPDDGEIDIMEQTGANKGQVLGTIHTRAYNYFNGSLGPGQGSSRLLSGACSDFHTYQLLWSDRQIQIGVDGTYYFTFTNNSGGDRTRWPFDRPQYLILNLAMGGDLGGPVPAGFTSDRLDVDYVRVYQKAAVIP